MKERLRFIDDLESCLFTMTELCAHYGISRRTGYKWAERHLAEGVEGLRDRSRAPAGCPHRMAEPVEAALLATRRSHPSWGPRKLLGYLARRHQEWAWPAPSTVGDLLKRHGLVEPQRRQRRHPRPERIVLEALSPNDMWSIDFKGEFRTGDRRLCYPLTVADRCSRFLLGCQSLPSTATEGAQPVLEGVFREYGLPSAILSDNGSPFSSQAIRGLSRLSVWWIRLGIQPLLIDPGHPEQNGGHERMHGTLKAETARPPADSLRAQQQRFDAFRRCFNEERPHEALGQEPPAEHYAPSPRSYPDPLPEIEYPGHFEIRRVRGTGEIKWQGQGLYVSMALAGELVGLQEVEDGVWALSFGPVVLGRFHERERRLIG